MDNELSQLDALIESDVLDALGKEPKESTLENTNLEDEILIEDLVEINENKEEVSEEENNNAQEIETQKDDSINETEEDVPLLEEPLIENIVPDIPIQAEQNISTASLSKLLSDLLNNKTIEITIKIKE